MLKLSERDPRIQQIVKAIRALTDDELREYQSKLEAEQGRAEAPRWYGFHIWWNLREVNQEWLRRA